MADKIECIYWGEREAMIAEVSAFISPLIAPAQSRYLVMPYGNGQWDTYPAATESDARLLATDLAHQENVPAYRV
jgi:hypothetical protein